MEAFRLANLIDDSENWTDGSTTVVQVGNVLDRGGDEITILYFLERLRQQANKTDGKVINMNSNHEIMNMESNFRYVDGMALLWFYLFIFFLFYFDDFYFILLYFILMILLD